MATTNSKKRKLSVSNVLLLVLRILPIVVEGLNRESEGNLETASIQFQFNPFSGKLDAFVDSGMDKNTVQRTVQQTIKPLGGKTAEALQQAMSKTSLFAKKEGIDLSVEFRR